MPSFLVIENFTRPEVWGLWSVHLLQASALAAVAITIGYGAVGRIEGATAPVLTVVWFLTGLGILVPLIAAPFLLHVARGPVVLTLVALAVGGALCLRGAGALLAVLKESLRLGWWLLPILMASSLSGLLPPYRYDEMSYHAAYPFQWLQQGGLTVDPNMQFPFYTFNLHVLFATGMMLGDLQTTHFFVWAIGSAGVLIILVFLRECGVPSWLGALAGLAFYFSPVVQRYLNIGYLDVPLNTFVLGTAFLAFLSAREPLRMGDFWAFAVSCGLLLGTKISQAPFYAFVFGFLAWRQWRHGGWAYHAGFLAITVLTGGFWYLRNLVMAGDPLWPMISVGSLGRENIWSVQDLALAKESMSAGLNHLGARLLTLPWMMTRPDALNDYPAGFFVLLPPVAVVFWKRLTQDQLWPAWGVLAMQALLWIWIAPVIRNCYLLALGAVFAALVIWYAAQALRKPSWVPARAWQAAGVAGAGLALFGPSKQWLSYATHNYNRRIPVTSEEVAKFVGYGDDAIPKLISQTLPGLAGNEIRRVYALGLTPYRIYFQMAGFDVIGNDFGPFRLRDFVALPDADSIERWMDRSRLDALVVEKAKLAALASDGGGRLLRLLCASGRLSLAYESHLVAVFAVSPAAQLAPVAAGVNAAQSS